MEEDQVCRLASRLHVTGDAVYAAGDTLANLVGAVEGKDRLVHAGYLNREIKPAREVGVRAEAVHRAVREVDDDAHGDGCWLIIILLWVSHRALTRQR